MIGMNMIFGDGLMQDIIFEKIIPFNYSMMYRRSVKLSIVN